ncbi:S8 family serine peptidase [Haliea sp. E17]|uniref:S8 family serine peptidase n=1 Tax=Haliea sp. E17 TaxID=3401576 RepID=UPI003AAF8609
MTQKMRIGFLALLILALPPSLALAADSKPVIEKKDDLPRHEYQLDVKVVDLYEPANRSALLKLAAAVAADAQSDLANYDIRDDNTVQDFYTDLGTVALLESRWQDYLDLLEKRRALETKEANRLTMGLVGEVIARTELAGTANAANAFGEELLKAVEALPYATVQDNLKSTKGRTEFLTRPLVLGNLESTFQPLLDNTGGKISYDVASALVGVSFTLDYFIPNAGAINEVLGDYIAANDVAKEDIWAARTVDLAADAAASPTVISVWDSGVDTAIFGPQGQLWTNTAEQSDGADDDGDGYVDDIHGVAYDLESNKVTELLHPIQRDFGVQPRDWQQYSKGLGDMLANVDSEEAAALRKHIAALPQAEVKDFLESLNLYSGYAHGTHVAGIALEGNPFARLLVARMTYNHTQMPLEPTLEQAERDAAMFREVGAYFRNNKVRAVNMSWGGSLRSIEEALEAHNVGASVDERKALAREIYDIGDAGLREAIGGSPEILFITSAGNSDNDVKFDEFYPSSYEYPNLLSVGAVDSAGDETSFTSLGKVDIYANGFEVESYVPGGDRIKFSGTSMASPQVLNLAAKLWALDPALSVAEVRSLILDGADEKQLESRTIKLLNPKASVALLEQRKAP